MKKLKYGQWLIAVKSILYTILILLIPTGITWIMLAMETNPDFFTTLIYAPLALLTVVMVSYFMVYGQHNYNVRAITTKSTISSGLVIVSGFVISFFGLI